MAVKYDDVYKWAAQNKGLSGQELVDWAVKETNRENQAYGFAPTGNDPAPVVAAPAPTPQTWDKPATMFLVGQDRQDYANYLQNQVDSGAAQQAYQNQIAGTPGIAQTWTPEAMEILPYKWSQDDATRRAATQALAQMGITGSTPLPQGFVNPNFLPGGYNPVTGQTFQGHTAFSGMANTQPGGDISGGLGQNGAFNYLQSGGTASPGGYIPTGSPWENQGMQGGGITPGGMQWPAYLQPLQQNTGSGGTQTGGQQGTFSNPFSAPYSAIGYLGGQSIPYSMGYGYSSGMSPYSMMGGYGGASMGQVPSQYSNPGYGGMPFLQSPMFGGYSPSFFNTMGYGSSSFGGYSPYGGMGGMSYGGGYSPYGGMGGYGMTGYFPMNYGGFSPYSMGGYGGNYGMPSYGGNPYFGGMASIPYGGYEADGTPIV